MGYQTSPTRSLALWHAPGRSDITQPPMYGHALRVLAERGFAVEHLHDAATAGLSLGAIPQGWAALAGEGVRVLEGACTHEA